MKTRSCLIVLIFAAHTSAQENKLTGTWRSDISDTQSLILTITETAVELKFDNGTVLMSGQLTFPKETPDKHFDWVELKAGDKPLPDNKCLYRLSKDTLLIIGGGANRPTKFLSGPGAEPRPLIFTRSK